MAGSVRFMCMQTIPFSAKGNNNDRFKDGAFFYYSAQVFYTFRNGPRSTGLLIPVPSDTKVFLGIREKQILARAVSEKTGISTQFFRDT